MNYNLHMAQVIQELTDNNTAERIGAFLTGPNAFEQTWAPSEKELVEKAAIDSVGKKNHQYWFVEDDGKIIAAIGVRENKYGSGGYEMDSDYVAVHKEYRKQGLASILLKTLEDYVKKKGGRYIHVLSCDIDSYAAARAFYVKNGYRKVGEIPNYYVEGEGRVDYFKEL
jgi:ribosomal protein S18 acetylase RimI-like enzyme